MSGWKARIQSWNAASEEEKMAGVGGWSSRGKVFYLFYLITLWQTMLFFPEWHMLSFLTSFFSLQHPPSYQFCHFFFCPIWYICFFLSGPTTVVLIQNFITSVINYITSFWSGFLGSVPCHLRFVLFMATRRLFLKNTVITSSTCRST